MRRAGLAIAVAGILVGLVLAWGLRERRAPRREPAPASLGAASPEPRAPDAALRPPGPFLVAPAPPPRSGAARRRQRQLLAQELRRALGREDASWSELERLAGLVLESRDVMHGEEPLPVRQEIVRRIAQEFERLAGEPMGDVISRLPRHEPDAPRPPRGPDSP